MRRESIQWAIICSMVLLSVFVHSCADSPRKPADVLVNPVDSTSPVFILPVTLLDSNYSEIDTLIIPSIRVKLKKEKHVYGFSYQLDNDPWTEYDTSVIYTVEDLDEGEHRIKVKAKHIDKKTEEANPKSIKFYVNAVRGPSLMFSGRKIKVAKDASFSYPIMVEEVNNLFGIKASFQYDSTKIRITNITAAGALRYGMNDPVLMWMKSPNSIRTEMFFIVHDTLKNKTWSDTVMIVHGTALSPGTTILDFYSHIDSVRFRTASNQTIPLTNRVKGKVEIK